METQREEVVSDGSPYGGTGVAVLPGMGLGASFSLFLFLVVVEIEPRVSHIVGKCSATELHPQLIFLFF